MPITSIHNSTMTPRPRYVVEFVPTGKGPAPDARVQQLLKLAGRACGLKCVDVREVHPGNQEVPR